MHGHVRSIAGSICVGLLMAACGAQGATSTVTPVPVKISSVTPSPLPSPTITPVPTADSSIFEEDFQVSGHAAGYDLGKGPNTFCAHCHSPLDWDPMAHPDPPPNCVSCKFEFEDEARIAVSNPLIPEADWHGITCAVCHVGEDEQVNPELAWFDAEVDGYETVANPGELCEKCHRDTETLRHQRDLTGVHADFQCTQCHQAHSVRASCSDCHTLDQDHLGTDIAHAYIDCTACHDASGMQVGPREDGLVWTSFRTVALLGRESSEPYQSHSLQRMVDCTRCHFPDNPWDLTVEIE